MVVYTIWIIKQLELHPRTTISLIIADRILMVKSIGSVSATFDQAWHLSFDFNRYWNICLGCFIPSLCQNRAWILDVIYDWDLRMRSRLHCQWCQKHHWQSFEISERNEIRLIKQLIDRSGIEEKPEVCEFMKMFDKWKKGWVCRVWSVRDKRVRYWQMFRVIARRMSAIQCQPGSK